MPRPFKTRVREHLIKHPGETARQCARNTGIEFGLVFSAIWEMVNIDLTMREQAEIDGIHYYPIAGEIGDVNE